MCSCTTTVQKHQSKFSILPGGGMTNFFNGVLLLLLISSGGVLCRSPSSDSDDSAQLQKSIEEALAADLVSESRDPSISKDPSVHPFAISESDLTSEQLTELAKASQLSAVSSSGLSSSGSGHKQSKQQITLNPPVISMLMMIRLQNAPCQAEIDNANGTCYPRNQCSQLGGTASGTCAAGFGVCCVFQKSCNTESNQNVTYFMNPEWPGTYDGSIECPITVQKVDSNICQFRLDFEEFRLAQPEPVDHLCESDLFVVSGGRPVPPICGENTGQHMYIDAGPSTSNIKINIVTSGSSYGRKWRVKVSQIQCNAQYRAGDSCLQYFTGMSGRIKSFNYGDPKLQNTNMEFGMQLSSQEYSVCVRAEEGFCGIVYVPCKDIAMETEAFAISSTSQNATEPQRTMSGAEQCPSDWIGIACATDTGRELQTDNSACVDRLCGGTFTSLSGSTAHAPVYSFSRPFSLRVHFNDFEMSDPRAPDQYNRGFCLDFVQQPCPQSGK